MATEFFKDVDFSGFWDDGEYSRSEYVEEPPSDELIRSVEQELGYRLPASYIELMRRHNGGMVHKNCFPTTEPTLWAEDHVAISGIFGIGRNKTYSLCGELGSAFMMREWGYPDTGVYVCDCPSSGHDMILLDYSRCGPAGEPEVVHVDQERDYKKTFLAKDFETFIRGLVPADVYEETPEEDRQKSLEDLKAETLSNIRGILSGNQKK